MKKILLAASLILSVSSVASAVEFVSTDKPDELFNLGVRVGINTSNRTINSPIGSTWNVNGWGTGFDAGVVADLNFRDFISVQPGFFFESRSGSFAYKSSLGNDSELSQMGKGRAYFFTIPVMAVGHFNILEDLRWNVEFGPYFQFKLKSTFDKSFSYPSAIYDGVLNYYSDVKTSKFDFGFKMGTSLDICNHYYVGVHYVAGMLRAWNYPALGGRNKEWLFSIGYNF